MVYTRGQKSALLSAAHSLSSLRAPGTSSRGPRMDDLHSTQIGSRVFNVSTTSSLPAESKLWSQWTNWYHAFLSEVTDEYPHLPVAERRAQATSRWVTFASKQLHCSESQVRGWLRTADQTELVAAYA